MYACFNVTVILVFGYFNNHFTILPINCLFEIKINLYHFAKQIWKNGYITIMSFTFYSF